MKTLRKLTILTAAVLSVGLLGGGDCEFDVDLDGVRLPGYYEVIVYDEDYYDPCCYY